MMDAELQRETESLTRSWMQHDPAMLGQYLVSGVEDPRINIQSLITRHFLAAVLFGDRFRKLQEQELLFAVTMNWLNRIVREDGSVEQIQALRHALAAAADNAEGTPIPSFLTTRPEQVKREAEGRSIPDYLGEALTAVEFGDEAAKTRVLGTFEGLWREVLADESSTRVSVLEAACGSANDYRFLDSYGLARLLDYSGFDLCEKNILNSQKLFPEARFSVGNAFAIEALDQAFSFTFVHDLFEHLSRAGLERALAEIGRVTQEGLCLGFFNLHEGGDHLFQPVDDYYWNRLSVARLRERIEQLGFAVQVVHIETFLHWYCGCSYTHNKNAYTLLAARHGSEFLAARTSPHLFGWS